MQRRGTYLQCKYEAKIDREKRHRFLVQRLGKDRKRKEAKRDREKRHMFAEKRHIFTEQRRGTDTERRGTEIPCKDEAQIQYK